jgi:hypothetical protein
MLQAGKSRVRFPIRPLDFFYLPNPSSRIVAAGLSQPLTKMSARNFSGEQRAAGLRVWLITSPPSVSSLFRRCGGASTSHNPMGLHGLLKGTLRSWVRIPIEAWMSVCLYCVCAVLCVGSAALRRTDPPSKESYRLCIGLRN